MDTVFYLWFVAILTGTFCLSATRRYHARRNKPGASRLDESFLAIALRLLGAIPVVLILLVYCLAPAWLAWASFSAPAPVRWLGVLLGITGIAALGWVFRSIGDNVSETVLTKPDHQLVMHGPYRWIRHPLYTCGLMQFFALGLISASVLLVGISVLGAIVFRCLVIPREESNLLKAFGEAYASYQSNTWALIPWVT